MAEEIQFTVTVAGLKEEFANRVSESFVNIIKYLQGTDAALDLRRMKRVIFTTDFEGAFADLATQRPSGNPITYTNETYGRAIGKVLLLPDGEDHEIVPVFDAIMAGVLVVPADSQEYEEENLMLIVHALHHELCHVHDDNKKIDMLKGIMLKEAYTGKTVFTGPLTEVCWAEYFANRTSAWSAPEKTVREMVESFRDALLRTKNDVDREIRSYRRHADLQHLMELFGRHGEFLMKAAAYTLGYIDGLNKPLTGISPETANALSGSYFEPVWDAAHQALKGMFDIYPDSWRSLAVYDRLTTVIEDYYDRMGFILSTTENGGAYVKIPFRAGTL